MSYEDVDNFILDLAKPDAVPLGAAAVGFMTVKKLASGGVPEAASARFAASVNDIRHELTQLVSYELQKESSDTVEFFLGQLQQISPEGFSIPEPVEKTAGVVGDLTLEQQSIVSMRKLAQLVGPGAPLYHTLKHLTKVATARANHLVAQIPDPAEKTAQEKFMGRLQKISTFVVDSKGRAKKVEKGVSKAKGAVTELFREHFPSGSEKVRRGGKTVYEKRWKDGKTVFEKGRDHYRGKGTYVLDKLKTRGGSATPGSRGPLPGRVPNLSPKAKALLMAGGLTAAAAGGGYLLGKKMKKDREKQSALGVSPIPVRSHEFEDDVRREREKKAARLVALAKLAQPRVVPPPNMDSPEAYVARERQMQLDQAMQELAHAKMQLNQTAMMAQQAQQEGMQAQQQLQEADMQLQETQAQADQAAQMSQAHQQQAIEAETRAAQHATQKMQLGMRVQQMRQALAEIATQDPVTETAAGASDLAAQGAPATPEQIAQEEEQAMAAQQPPPNEEVAEEEEQAMRAQEEAQQQTAQAEAAASGGPAAAAAAPAEAPAGGMAAA